MDTATEFIRGTSKDEVVVVMTQPEEPSDTVLARIPFEEFCKLTEESDRFIIISTSIRIGWAYFSRYLELTYFPPMSEKNLSFIMFHFQWKDMPFSAISVLKENIVDINESLAATNMNGVFGAVPSTIDGTGIVMMPVNAENCITIENGENHVAYGNNFKAASCWEERKIHELEVQHGIDLEDSFTN